MVVDAGSVPDAAVDAAAVGSLLDAAGARAFDHTSAMAGSSLSAAHSGALKTAVNANTQPSAQAMRRAALIDAPALPMLHNPAFPAELL